jgi:hypothetical protein
LQCMLFIRVLLALLMVLFPSFADMNKMRIIGDNNFGEQKSHHRCRRKKHDVRMLDSLR